MEDSKIKPQDNSVFYYEKLSRSNYKLVPGKFPEDWTEVVSRISLNWCGNLPKTKIPLFFIKNTHVILSHTPSVSTLASVLLNRNVYYLCWGVPRKESSSIVYMLKVLRLKIICRKARVLMVNDKLMKDKLTTWSDRCIYTVPYSVDTNFFSYSKNSRLDRNILISGDNDRNENLALELSDLGWTVHRVTRSESVYQLYNELKKPNVILHYRVQYIELRYLYQMVNVVVMPIKSKNHPAGQTALLEAISCGAPVVVSSGHASKIFDHYESVFVVNTNCKYDWHEAIKKAQKVTPITLRKSREGLLSYNSTNKVLDFFSKFISSRKG